MTHDLVKNEVVDDPGTLNEEEQNENETECESCTVCDLIVTSDQEGIFCEEPWFQRKSAEFTRTQKVSTASFVGPLLAL